MAIQHHPFYHYCRTVETSLPERKVVRREYIVYIIFFIMTPLRRSIALALTIFLLSIGCAKRVATANPPAPPPPARSAELTLPPERPAGSCKSVNGFPDSTCTPGGIDPRVTQSNINTT